jgi:hypothetical protein
MESRHGHAPGNKSLIASLEAQNLVLLPLSTLGDKSGGLFKEGRNVSERTTKSRVPSVLTLPARG